MIGCLAWIRTKTNGVKARHAAVTPRGKELVEPEVVATSPYRIKSPVPVCCGFDSVELVGERGLAPPRLADSLSAGSSIPSEPLARNVETEMDPPVGDAPTGFLYKRNPQAAAWRRKWSQSRVLPSAELAYDACLSAGSIAKWSPHPELHRAKSLTERMHR